MMLATAAASVAGGVNAVFNYNRANYKYDRKMRQEVEFQILAFRAKQASMWRKDVRDLIELTEVRMDRYLIVNTIQLGVVLTLITQGRLEAGTPQWLLRFYMVSAGSAFLFLLMSMWLAMHASVVAQTTGTRILTQLVRLPIPTWQQIDRMRTFAASFETLGSNIMRVPFASPPGAPASTWNNEDASAWASAPPGTAAVGHHTDQPCVAVDSAGKPANLAEGLEGMAKGVAVPSKASSEPAASKNVDAQHFDVWGLEQHGEDIEELLSKAPSERQHVGMIQDDSLHWQCHDIFSRATMTLGTNHLIFAIIYYVLGYISVQDGAPIASWCVVALMLCTAVTLICLDFMTTPRENRHAIALIMTGPCCVSLTTFLMSARSSLVEKAYFFCLPLGYLAHAGWLWWFVRALAVEKHPNGAWLPMRFRPAAYLDVFSWYFKPKQELSNVEEVDNEDVESAGVPLLEDYSRPSSRRPSSRQQSAMSLGQTPSRRNSKVTFDPAEAAAALSQLPPSRRGSCASTTLAPEAMPGSRRSSTCSSALSSLGSDLVAAGSESASGICDDASWVRLKGHTDMGAEMQYLYNIDSGAIRSLSAEDEKLSRFESMTEEEFFKHNNDSAQPESIPSDSEYTAELDSSTFEPNAEPPRMFRSKKKRPTVVTNSFHGPATGFGEHDPGLIAWQMLRCATGTLIILWCTGPLLSFGIVGGPLEYGMPPMRAEDAEQADTDEKSPSWNAATTSVSSARVNMGDLASGQQVDVTWPWLNSFMPRSLSCDPSGRQLVVADDFGLYKSSLISPKKPKVSFSRAASCSEFEGQLVQDIDIVCREGTSECRILVLHANGRKMSECPLHKHGYEAKRRNLASADRPVHPVVTWGIAEQWLNSNNKEQVESLAVDKYSKDCLAKPASPDVPKNAQAFLPNGQRCIAVGTTSGRVVGLRRHVTESRKLVPEISVQHRQQPVIQGSLRILFNGIILALRHGGRTLQSINMKTGRVLGEWKLPHGISWISLCGGGSHLFILGRVMRGEDRRIVLWRFPIPPKLRSLVPPDPRDIMPSAAHDQL